MKRIPLIAGNWKMYKTTAEARSFISALSSQVISQKRRIFLAVPFPCIEGSVEASKGSPILIGAQNMHDQLEGAFTGEVSAKMLKSSGASFVILGHSERRQYFGETNTFIRSKVERALAEGLIPILCIGERSHEREKGLHEEVLTTQLKECLEGITAAQIRSLVIAYEPVWAIGTGKTATPEIAQTVHRHIRSWLQQRFGDVAKQMSLLYGGSVKTDNISFLMKENDIDGVLVGGAALDVKSFAQIVNYQ